MKKAPAIRDRIKELRRVKASELLANPGNWRTHPKAQSEALSAVLREVGYADALLARQTKKGLVLIDGHLRKTLTPDQEVPVLVLDVTEAEAKKILLTLDPLASLAIPDKQALDLLLKEVSTGDAALTQMLSDLAAESGLSYGEAPVDAPEAEIDRAAELQRKWKTKRGQAWQVGRHRLMCGDSTNVEDVGKLMKGRKADAVLTDPPYGQNQDGVGSDEPEKLREIVRGAVAALPVENAVIVAFQSPRTFVEWLDAVRANGHKFERNLWLYKAAQCTFPWRGWILTSESILVSTVGEGQWQEVKPYSHDCYYLPEVSGELADDLGWHGSVKPLTVVADLLKRICGKGQSVYDAFSGSGTTAVAAERGDRVSYGMELERENVAIQLERLSQMGLTPVLNA